MLLLRTLRLDKMLARITGRAPSKLLLQLYLLPCTIQLTLALSLSLPLSPEATSFRSLSTTARRERVISASPVSKAKEVPVSTLLSCRTPLYHIKTEESAASNLATRDWADDGPPARYRGKAAAR